MKKTILIITGLLLIAGLALGQNQMLADFEGNNKVTVIYFDGSLNDNFDHDNNMRNTVNESEKVARYEKPAQQYAVVVMQTDENLYAENMARVTASQKMSLKVYTDAPMNTKIQLQLGNIGISTYPQGIHSIYEAFTAAQNEWQELNFNFVMRPDGGFTDSLNVNKIVMLFDPEGTTSYEVFLDDLMGPEFTNPASVEKLNKTTNGALMQNYPNPAKNFSVIKYSVNIGSTVTLSLYDMVGREVRSLATGFHPAGEYNINLQTDDLNEGLYFYVLNAGGERITKKLTVVK
jgi:hypothetical protein